MKCYNVSCRSNDIQEENNCCDYIDFLKSVCDNFISEDAYNIKQLQAELKVYKRVVDLMAEGYSDAFGGCPESITDYKSERCEECKKDIIEGDADNCWLKHLKNQAKEG